MINSKQINRRFFCGYKIFSTICCIVFNKNNAGKVSLFAEKQNTNNHKNSYKKATEFLQKTSQNSYKKATASLVAKILTTTNKIQANFNKKTTEFL